MTVFVSLVRRRQSNEYDHRFPATPQGDPNHWLSGVGQLFDYLPLVSRKEHLPVHPQRGVAV